MAFLLCFIFIAGIYFLVLGFTFLSFPACRISRYRFALSRGTMNLWNAGLLRIVMGAALVLVSLALRHKAGDPLAMIVSLCLSGLVFSLFYFLQWITAKVTNLQPPVEIADSALLYEPLVGFLGIENKPEKDLRTNGWLALTRDSIIFKASQNELRIPLGSIVGLGAGLWHKRKTHLCPVLRVTYKDNDDPVDAGFAMGRTREWIDEILTSAGAMAFQIEVHDKEIPRRACRLMHFKVYGFLFLAGLFLASLLAALIHL